MIFLSVIVFMLCIPLSARCTFPYHSDVNINMKCYTFLESEFWTGVGGEGFQWIGKFYGY